MYENSVISKRSFQIVRFVAVSLFVITLLADIAYSTKSTFMTVLFAFLYPACACAVIINKLLYQEPELFWTLFSSSSVNPNILELADVAKTTLQNEGYQVDKMDKDNLYKAVTAYFRHILAATAPATRQQLQNRTSTKRKRRKTIIQVVDLLVNEQQITTDTNQNNNLKNGTNERN